jgi:arylsulfatase A-like enzyme
MSPVVSSMNFFDRISALLLAAVVLINGNFARATDAKPNIILILADDLGWGSVGCYGADANLVRTPNIDRLAREGRRFTDANCAASICSPSRYSILTGRYCWRTSLKFGVLHDKAPLHIETNRLTVASMLKAEGYATAAIGKWHLGFGASQPDFTSTLRPGPLDVGFDYFYGLPSNHGDPSGIYLDTEMNEPDGTAIRVEGLRSKRLSPFGTNYYGNKPFYGLDAPQRVDVEVMPHLTEKAIAWIDQQNTGRPFFLYFAPVAVHEPVTPSDITKGTSQAGIYGDWIHELDRTVGRLLDALDKQHLSDNTLVIFTSDNGGENRYGFHAWAGFEAGSNKKAIAAGLKLNGDWRAGKHSVYEGGLREPFIVRWPGKVPAATVSDEPICLVDTLATIAAVVGAKLPPPEQGAEDSYNVLPAILGEKYTSPIRPALVGHSGWGVFSVRQGSWKWIEGKYAPVKEPKSERNEFHPQLYNLADDPQETREVIGEHADIAAKLAALLEQYRQQGHSRD